MPNVEQSDYWDGAGGEHWVAEQVRYDKINAAFGARVVATLGPSPAIGYWMWDAATVH